MRASSWLPLGPGGALHRSTPPARWRLRGTGRRSVDDGERSGKALPLPGVRRACRCAVSLEDPVLLDELSDVHAAPSTVTTDPAATAASANDCHPRWEVSRVGRGDALGMPPLVGGAARSASCDDSRLTVTFRSIAPGGRSPPGNARPIPQDTYFLTTAGARSPLS